MRHLIDPPEEDDLEGLDEAFQTQDHWPSCACATCRAERGEPFIADDDGELGLLVEGLDDEQGLERDHACDPLMDCIICAGRE